MDSGRLPALYSVTHGYYYLYKTEATAAQYRRFCNETGHDSIHPPINGRICIPSSMLVGLPCPIRFLVPEIHLLVRI